MSGNKNSGRKGWETRAKALSEETGELVPASMKAIYADIKSLGMLHCTLNEASSYMSEKYCVDIPRETFHHFLKRDKRAAAAFEAGQGEGKLSLRRSQIKQAKAGNATMLVWMGKQWLDQTDKVEQSFDQKKPLNVVVEESKAAMLARVSAIAASKKTKDE